MNTPTKPGYYFARTDSYQWYNYIVEIYGESPFFKIRGWDRVADAIRPVEARNIVEFGPEIVVPKCTTP